ncbi:hypothetical protein ACFL34_02070 [Candidatus Sumerlaeota bacterium]
MNTRCRRFLAHSLSCLAAGLIILTSLGGCDGDPRYVRRNLESNPLEALPDDAESVMVLNAEAFRNAALTEFVLGSPLSQPALREDVTEKFLIVPPASVRLCAAAFSGMADQETMQWGVVFVGKFDEESIMPQVKSDSFELVESQYRTLKYFNCDMGSSTFSFSFFSPRVLVMANDAGRLCRMIELYCGAPGHVAESLFYKPLLEELPPENTFWNISRINDSERQILNAIAASLTEDPTEFSWDKAQVSIIELTITAELKLTWAILFEPDSGAAKQLSDLINGRIQEMSDALSLLESGAENSKFTELWTDLLKRFSVTADGDRLQLLIEIPADGFQKTLDTITPIIAPAGPPPAQPAPAE